MLNRASVLHFSVLVEDIHFTVSFYQSVFGFVVSLPPTEISGPLQRMTGEDECSGTVVQMMHQESKQTLEFITLDQDRPELFNKMPTAHLAFSVENLDDAIVEVTKSGAVVLGEIVEFAEGRSVYCREPGGSTLELEELFG